MSNMDFPAFAVACGEEGSDPLVLHEGQVVRVDQYGASSHLEHLDSDLADVAGLGVQVWRYGMPWRLTESEPGVYDWTLWDRALEACRRHGLDLGFPRAPQAWKKYCIATRISPSTPPMACWRARAKSGSGFSTRTGYCRRLSV